MKRAVAILVLLFIPFFSGPLRAADSGYPARQIELNVGFSPGGGTDLGARMIAEHSKKSLGQEIVVVNKPGGGGRVALTMLAKAKPDGYTIGAVTDGGIVFAPHLEKVSYKPLEDFTFISQYGSLDYGVVVLPDSPFRNFKDMIDFARANPEKLTISTVGLGTTNHVALDVLALMEKIKIKLVPFSGAALAMNALLGGHVMVASTASSGYASHVKAKTVRMLAAMGDNRVDTYPDVPTLKELGFPFVSQLCSSWYIILGPKNMETAAVSRLKEVFKKAMDSPEFIKLAKDLEIWTKDPLSGDPLKEGLIQRSKKYGEVFGKLGMAMQR